MQRHETPIHVARELCRLAPCRIGSIIDPAVGSGALLAPLMARLKRQGSRVTCVDSDPKILEEVEHSLRPRLGKAIRIVHADFMSWSESSRGRVERNGFDCVIMNPPFAAKKDRWIELDLSQEFPGVGRGTRCAPVEVAFLARGIRVLRPGGRLLAIMPSSLVSSHTTRWFRDCLLRAGAVTHVHELPQFTFPGVESRVYFFVFEKRKGNGRTVLCNHDLVAPEKMAVEFGASDLEHRFDYGYHFAATRLRELIMANDTHWAQLGNESDVFRGTGDSPEGPDYAVHTCDYRCGFWYGASRHEHPRRRTDEQLVQRGDILVKRVGRMCYQSFGKPAGIVGAACSDCVFVIRPRTLLQSTRLLFAVRSLAGLSWVRPLFERGTGASYLSEGSLRDLMVPMGLDKRFPKMFDRYRDAVSRRAFTEMQRIERWIAKRLEMRPK